MNSEPLLFIDSVFNKEVVANNQNIYDSRYQTERKIITKNHDSEFYIKLNRLAFMYEKNKTIICKVILLTKEEYLVIIKSINDNILNCIHLDNNNNKSFNINEIDEVTIETIN